MMFSVPGWLPRSRCICIWMFRCKVTVAKREAELIPLRIEVSSCVVLG